MFARFAAFPTAALSIVCTMYFSARPDSTWARWLCYQSAVIMVIIQLVCGANTIVGLVSRNGIFVLEKFLLPQQWGMMTHFAFRWVSG